MNVTKRDGRIEPLDITKIQKYTKDSVKSLSNVSQSELEVDAKIHFRDGITSKEIQQTLIKTAVDKIDIDRPDWTFVAARLFLYNLYHEVSPGDKPRTLKDHLQEGESKGKIIAGLGDMYDLEELNTHIKPERDMLFNYLGIKTLYDRYLLKDVDGRPMELPQHMFMTIAMFLAQKEEDKQAWAIKFYNMMSTFEVMMATPTLSNARTPRHQLSSCFIGSAPDNIEGIFDSFQEMGLLSKFGGGIGWDWTSIRSLGSEIDKNKKVAGGIVPQLNIVNSIVNAYDQLGVRKGAIAVYLEPWHMDINGFLDLKKNSGEERHRAHDLFPALWINDIFMERVQENSNWTLFDPYETAVLTELHGFEFTEQYLKFEKDATIRKEVIPAKTLWKKILTSYFETGSPFLCFKDNANRVNPNYHTGIIRSSNLCTEIFQNTCPDTYKTKIIFEDHTYLTYDENQLVRTDAGITKEAKALTSLDNIGGKKIFVTSKEKEIGDTAVCNLASVNLSRVNTKKDIERIVPIAIRALDNVIDLNFYPDEKVKCTNLKTRAIGLGVMGEAELLAKRKIHWGSTEHLHTIDRLMEMISYNAIKSSSELAVEKEPYPEFEGSKWSKGILPFDHTKDEVKQLVAGRGYEYDWDKLGLQIIKNGMRNGYLMAIAPTSTISILTGTTQAIEPVYKRKWFEENLSGLIPVVVPSLNPDTWEYYTPSYEVSQLDIIKAGAVRQRWLDQGQSLNIFITTDKASGKYLNDIYMLAWNLGLKSTYYLRSQSPEAKQDVEDRSMECSGCQ